MADLLSRVATLCVIAVLLAVGWCILRRRLLANAESNLFAQEFLKNLQAFMTSQGADTLAYSWLTQRSVRMQRELGAYGFLEVFHRPFQDLLFRNAPVILTLLPELYGELTRGGLTGGYGPAIAQYQQTLQEVLVRHIGILDDCGRDLRAEIRNPLLWLREGVRSVMFLPISLLGWFGIIPAAVVRRITLSMFARFLAAFLALLSLISAVVTIVVGWEEFLTKAQALLR